MWFRFVVCVYTGHGHVQQLHFVARHMKMENRQRNIAYTHNNQIIDIFYFASLARAKIFYGLWICTIYVIGLLAKHGVQVWFSVFSTSNKIPTISSMASSCVSWHYYFVLLFVLNFISGKREKWNAQNWLGCALSFVFFFESSKP